MKTGKFTAISVGVNLSTHNVAAVVPLGQSIFYTFMIPAHPHVQLCRWRGEGHTSIVCGQRHVRAARSGGKAQLLQKIAAIQYALIQSQCSDFMLTLSRQIFTSTFAHRTSYPERNSSRGAYLDSL